MRHSIFCVILCLIFFCVTGCVDDLFTDDPDFGDGKCKVTATVDFIPMSANFMQTKSPGNALGEIESLHVLLYDYSTKKILKKWQITEFTTDEERRTDADAENGHAAEDTTRQAKFTLPEEVDYGRYYMYAVANIPDLLDNPDYSKYLETVDGLKSLPLTWNSANVRKNAQMLGYFTKSDEMQPEDDALVLHEYAMNVHSWLRRAASKVTVAYDGSELKEGVFVYIKSVTIKDIPKQCYLGKSNNVGAADYALDCPALGKETEMPDGDSIVYYQGAEPKDFGPEYSGPRIASGSPYYGDHGKNAEALFFYENMQGAGDRMPDKRQDANGDSILDYPGLPNDPVKYPNYRLKDSVRYGSYIEVKAHYVSINSEKMGNGSIVYRFMLGQDVKRDYNARRNCHYKLTLKLKNFANDADWHIEYVEPEPSVVTPEKYYISYLYNKKMMFPLKVKTGGYKIKSITAHIKDNRWAPFEANHWVYYYQMDKENENQWNGFLSLHKTTATVIEPVGDAYAYNKIYYEKDPKRGDRVYDKFGADGEYTTINSDPDDKYRVETSTTESDCYNVYLPMYTRAKQMVIVTGYTGNNPYVAYMRKAVVEFTVELTNGLKMHSEVPIFQVRRIVNPKGIYRSATCVDPFHVTLMRLPREEATEFETFPSEGSWKAYIVRETHNGSVTLAKTLPTSVQVGDTVFGKTGSIIDFDVKFKATPATENHYTVIRVDYHNYSCEHLIFIRQGNQPDSLYEGGALWYAENMKDSLHRADSPLEEGSLFKYGNWTQAIDAMNNKNPVSAEKPYWVNVEPGDFKLYPADGFDLAGAAPGAKKVPWSGIWTGSGFADVGNMRVATYEDYKGIYDRSYMEQGYGVLYGDDATKVAVNIKDVYGYDYKNKKGRGMRGCFVYNSNTGKNLFFPIGASGYGHRKHTGSNDATDKAEIAPGMLRYAASRHTYYGLYNPWGDPQEPTNRPLFHDIFRRPGAIYYIRSAVDGKLGWDINYFTFDFNGLESGSVSGGKDACFIRCIKIN